jgi:threonine synthase
MARVLGLQCLRCGAAYPAGHYAEDCPACREMASSNLVVVYDEAMLRPRPRPTAPLGPGLWRYGDLLPVTPEQTVSLGEGGSPLHRLEHTGAALGLAGLFAKDETRNPTWSFKDRLACVAVSAARVFGARVIVSSSSGNAGAAAAAYAARADLPCVVFTFKGVAGPMLTQMRAYGATVVAVEAKEDRWTLMEHAVKRFGWFPTSPFFGPVVGSNPYGIEGYKTLAYEIAEALDWQVPDWCVLPVCYGDALVGVWRGFSDMMALGWTDRMPRMGAAEVSGSLTVALAEGADAPPDIRRNQMTLATSIGATRGTYQALDIVRRSGGAAVAVDDDTLMRWQQQVARTEGFYIEPSTAAAPAAVERLVAEGRIASGDRVVCLFTASGLKDAAATGVRQGELLTVPAGFDAAVWELRRAGVFPDS